jgi:SAM-dependent methyltransferase
LSWKWDDSLYAGSAAYYARGRLAYPQAVADALRDELELDGSGRLLDIGCGPGSLTFLLAPLFAEAIGIDADAAMIAEARARAVEGTRFVHMRAEELPAGLGMFRLATFAQSFHWLDRSTVARTVLDMLEPGGALVHVGATTHRGDGDVPHDQIAALVRSYLGPGRRAGRGTLHEGTPADEDEVLAAIGAVGARRVALPGGEEHARSEEDVVAAVFSLSSSAPHLFGDRLEAFECDLRALLRRASPDRTFHETARGVELRIWQRP